jgi:hypothetical protein
MYKLFIIAILFSNICNAQNWTNVNGRWGYQWMRHDSALFIPSGNGAPAGTASLRSAKYKKQAALFSDTTNKKLYLFNPKDSTWIDVTAGGGGISALTGPVTAAGSGSVATSITNNAITNAMLAQMTAHTFKGNNTGSTANAGDLTAAQLTAELNVFGAGLKGLAPAASGSPSSSKYLSEDGTYSIPAGGGGATLQTVTTAGNTSTNDIIVGARTNSLGRFSVEKTFTALNVHAFDDYSTLNPSSGGFGFGVYDASTTMVGAQTNDHFVGYQSRLTVGSGSTTNINGAYGLTGLLVFNHHPGSGTVTNAHGVYIKAIDGGGPITNAYGLRIENVISGTNNFAIRAEGGKNSFVGEVMIGGQTTPIAKLDVRNSTWDPTLYCDNTKGSATAAIFNSSNGSGSNICLDLTASGGTGNKGISFAASAMTSNDWNYYANNSSKFYNKGNAGIGNGVTTPDSTLQINGSFHNNAGVRMEGLPSGAGTKAVRIDANGSLSIADTTISGAGNYYALDRQYTDANNSGTSATDLYTYTIPANTLSANGNTINFDISGTLNDATATVNLQVIFAGNGISGTGALTISGTGNWSIRGRIIRTGTSTARSCVITTIDNSTNKVYTTTSVLSGLDFTTTNILKVTATAGGAGGGSNDITGQIWEVYFNK